MAKMKREQLNALATVADLQLSGTYHQVYEKLGARKGNRGPNYHCFEEHHHEGGIDDKPSMGIDNETGVYHCFACDVKGNLYTFWKNYAPTKHEYYHEFLIDGLGVDFIDTESGEDFSDADAKKVMDLYDKLKDGYTRKRGKEHQIDASVIDSVNKAESVPKDELDRYVSNLLNNTAALEYLETSRKISKETIKKYSIGLTDKSGGKQRAFTFPVISPDGITSTIKLYNPVTKKDHLKWSYMYRNRDQYPVPIQNFASDTLYFFEGEPDTFCAIGFGIKGAITLGGASNNDPVKILGEDLAKRYLSGKEIVICMDADKAGKESAAKLARSVHPFARQVKIIDLDISDINPFGLDPDNTITKVVSGKTKEKRVEKDFTDFMRKNGFGDIAKERFADLISKTKAYTDSRERGPIETYKVTVAESRLPKYHSEYGGAKKRLEVIASVSDLDSSAYLFDDIIPVTCAHMTSPEAPKKCIHCSMISACGPKDDVVEFELHTKMPKEYTGNIKHISIVEKDILEMIEVNEKAKLFKVKSLLGINTSCTQVRIRPGRSSKVIHAKLMSDVNFHSDSKDLMYDSNIDVDAFILGEDVQAGRSYKFEGVQTTSPDGQYAAIFVDKIVPVLTNVESFKMSHDMNHELSVFKVKDDETIDEHLKRRYKEFSSEAKITGRDELFFMYDLAFFSSTSFNNPLISDSVRKWVEVGVVGESRVGKSMVAEYLVNKYRTGEYFSCSSSISRSGILGGIAKQFNGKNKISWGIMPKNDNGLVVIDEVANMSVNLLSDMTPSRSSGVVNVEMTISGKARARTRKIFVSNPRDWTSIEGQPFEGMAAIRNVFERDEIIQRFDMMYYVKADDVDIDDYEFHYEPGSTEFTDLQCRHLVMWAHSRGYDDYVWEGGAQEFNRYVSTSIKRLHDVFHDKTLLVGQESSVRVIRMAVALAAMLYSTPDGKYDKVLITHAHVDRVIAFTLDLYTRKNMRLDEYSEQIRASETLGDMRFMENIVKYVSVDSIIRESNFNEKSIQQVFFDYLQRVSDKSLFMVDAANDTRKMTGIQTFNAVHKLIQTMVARNCLIRVGNKFEKTPMYTSWLDKMRWVEEDELSSILEYETDPGDARENQSASSLTAKFEASKGIRKRNK